MKKTVLVVDDAKLMRQMLCDILEEAGYKVIAEAQHGDEAVALYAQHQPDLVTMDVLMPQKNGVEAVREIVKNWPTARIFMISSIGQESLIQEAIDAGAADFVVKPFRKEDVLDAAQRVLNRP